MQNIDQFSSPVAVANFWKDCVACNACILQDDCYDTEHCYYIVLEWLLEEREDDNNEN